MSRITGKNKLFKGFDITLIALLSVLGLGILVFSTVMIWLLSVI